MNEAETRAELIDPKLNASGWGVVEGSRIFREKSAFKITLGKIQTGGTRGKSLTADYVLAYKGIKLAVIEAKSADKEVGEGVAQAKLYAEMLQLAYAFSTNGKEIYRICMRTGKEDIINKFPTPLELWNDVYNKKNDWREKFSAVPFEDKSGTWQLRYYQEIAVRNALEAIANNKQRILLTLATGTGKTAIAFQIAWKLYETRWNLSRDGKRRPQILFLADRNILADQAFNSFSSFPEDALIRIKPAEIRRHGRVPKNGCVFFTIFQTFMSGTDENGNPAPYFGDYNPDFFDFIIIDECHRGGANDESNWRAIMEHFAPAVQLGLTATPRRAENVDTYKYFGEPVYKYSLKDGINDGFLTPFKLKRIKTSLDNYTYSDEDKVLEGKPEKGKTYTESDFNRIIEIKEREAKRIRIYLDDSNQNEKALVFCKSQAHAALMRDIFNQLKESKDVNYCVRVTSDDGEIGEQFLRDFQDNEKSIPTILTTSHKLSTGVDARNVRNIVLFRPITSMIEFKQIIGRGTRLFDNKEFFTIYDFVDAYHHFNDPSWDGEPICEKCDTIPCKCKEKPPAPPCSVCKQKPCICEKPPKEPCPDCGEYPCECPKTEKIKIKLADGKERMIKHFTDTMFFNPDGDLITAKEFIELMYGKLPDYFSSEEELRKIWSFPDTRKALLTKLEYAGFGKETFSSLQKVIDAEKSDIFDVLSFISYAVQPITREKRVELARSRALDGLDFKHKEFVDFVLSKYIDIGVEELDDERLPVILQNKYLSLNDGIEQLGDVNKIRSTFIEFQKHLYENTG